MKTEIINLSLISQADRILFELDRILFELDQIKQRIELMMDEIAASQPDDDRRKPNGEVTENLRRIIKAAK